MTRFIEQRLILNGTLVCDTPLGIAGVESLAHSDTPLIRDGSGEVFIPGTSLAGAIRGFLRQIPEIGEPPLERLLWGAAPKKGETGSDAAASLIVLADAPLEGDGVSVEMRDGVGIDPVDGRAATGIKYDREVAPRGARFDFRFELEVTSDLNAALARAGTEPIAIPALVRAALEKGRIHFGAAGTRGLGRLRLEDAVIERQRIGDRDGVLAFLRGGGERVNDAAHRFALPPRLSVTLDWTPQGPLMVRAREDGSLGDMLPLTGADGSGALAPVLPGASVKGALRAIAERIMATVRDDGASATDFLAIKGAEADPLVAVLFGQPRPRKGEVDGTVAPELRGRGALAVADLYGDALSPDFRTLALTGEGREAVRQMRAVGGDVEMHVAVDRWTAAPVDGKLFGAVTLTDPGFPAIVLEIDPPRLLVLGEARALAALALLVLVLREARAGGLALGGGALRGWGAVGVQTARFAVEGDAGWLAPLDGFEAGMADGPGFILLHEAWLAEIGGGKAA